MLNKKGFTLAEVVVTMGIFVVVMVLSSTAFERIVGKAAQRSRAMEGQTEGIVGFESFRTDLEGAGYGLAFATMSSVKKLSYLEAVDSPNFPVSGVNRADLNDAPKGAPRGLVAVNGDSTIGFNGSDYLVVKSTLVAQNKTCKKSSRINYVQTGSTSSVGTVATYGSDDDLQSGERAIVVRSVFEDGREKRRELVIDGAEGGTGAYYVTVSTTLPAPFSPPTAEDRYFIYGIDPAGLGALRMPFNRADYFLMRPSSIAGSCNSGTGVFYKATTNHTNGGITYYPLVDCIGDMQVVFVLDMDRCDNDGNFSNKGDGVAGTYSNADGSQISSMEKVFSSAGSIATTVSAIDVIKTLHDPRLLRQRLKEVQVYILAQNGSIDPNFTYSDSSILVGDPVYAGLGRMWSADAMKTTFGDTWRNFHWKVYKIVATSANMQQ